MQTPQKIKGFTLIELMIVVAIVGIIMAFAIPSYLEQIRRGNRTDARAQLLKASQYMQRYYASNDRYDQDRAGVAFSFPGGLSKSPETGDQKYTITATATLTAYTVTAVPFATGSMFNDVCGTLGLDHTGLKSFTGASPATLEKCWR